MALPILQAKNLSKHQSIFGKSELLFEKVNLVLPAGEMVIITGASGAGKTSLINVFGGFSTPDKGELLLEGQLWNRLSHSIQAKYRRTKLGYVPQEFNLLRDFTVKENVAMPLLLDGCAFEKAFKEAEIELEHVHLGHRAEAFPESLSGGEKQRAALARALIINPSLFIADEPFSQLDPKTAHKTFTWIKKRTIERGAAAILVLHDLTSLQGQGWEYQLVDKKLLRVDRRINKGLPNEASF